MIVRTYTRDEIDVIAAYCVETNGTYLLTSDDFADRRIVHLRVAPTLNNQEAGINRAEDFAFGARLTALVGP
jgi:hypothetical protein